ncbi:uncharacterized protein LOC113360026 [Papaver somniferum]|uniref:uncharacterized protein LOC113360026 n=1 Tax=Papaver somniferum TaxID=3469 RepID=UPI000E6F87EC|nr:uncharacterized protein LOC113360026 [Papaver somniferum]
MDLPRLKVLWIHGVSIPNEELSKRLFSSCPVLEKLSLCHCDIPNLIVNSLSLKKFLYKRLLGSTDNVIKLTTPNLKAFECTSCEEVVYAIHTTKFLREACMVKNLWLSYGLLEVLSRAPDLLDSQQQPCLFNVRSLYLKMRSTRGCLRAIAYLLKISPRVQSPNLVDVGEDWEAGLSSEGMLSRLTYVCFCEVEGCDAELKLLSFLLKHGHVLTKVALSFCAGTCSPDGERDYF